MTSFTDYHGLWQQWKQLMAMSKDKRKARIDALPITIQVALAAIGHLALDEAKRILADRTFGQKDRYMNELATTFMLCVFDGYMFYVISNSNLLSKSVANNPTDSGVILDRWIVQYEKDEQRGNLRAIDQVIDLYLKKMAELRINQVIIAIPSVVSLSYELLESVHQYFDWATHQGYVLGMTQRELRIYG